MKLSVITPTCRSNPRFAEMARTLFASFRRAPADAELEWIIVDERLWWEPVDRRGKEIAEALSDLPGEVASRIHVEHFAPPPTRFRGPDVSDPLPAHNTARNAGVAALSPDSGYVVILSDCTAVTGDWVSVALELASKGWGWKPKIHPLHDHVVPKDQPLKYQDCWDSLHPVDAKTVAGPCWGVPKETMTACGGFDSDYDGEDDLYDHEILLRLARVGVSFVTTKRAGVVRMNRTRLKTEVTTRQETFRATRNRAYYHELLLDRDRILPGAAKAAASRSLLGGGTQDRAPRPAQPPAQARAPQVAPPRSSPNAAARARPAGSLPRAATPVPAPARAGDDLGVQADGTVTGAVSIFATPGGVLHLDHPGQLASDETYKPMPDDNTRPMTLQERARALKQAKLDRAAAEANGTAAPLTDEARCVYVPTQGGHKGIRCEGKRAHGGPHKYPPLETQPPAPVKAQPVAPQPPAVPREPPEPSPALAKIRDQVDEHIHAIAEQLAPLPNDVAKTVVMLAVCLRREGVLADVHTFRALIAQAIPKPEDREVELEVWVEMIQEICLGLPPMPIGPADFRALNVFAKSLDTWRKLSGLQTRALMTLTDRGYAAAADAGVHIQPPDDLRHLDDEVSNFERAVAASETEDDVISVEPLTEEEAAAMNAAAEKMAEMERAIDSVVEEMAGAPDVPPVGAN